MVIYPFSSNFAFNRLNFLCFCFEQLKTCNQIFRVVLQECHFLLLCLDSIFFSSLNVEPHEIFSKCIASSFAADFSIHLSLNHGSRRKASLLSSLYKKGNNIFVTEASRLSINLEQYVKFELFTYSNDFCHP